MLGIYTGPLPNPTPGYGTYDTHVNSVIFIWTKNEGKTKEIMPWSILPINEASMPAIGYLLFVIFALKYL